MRRPLFLVLMATTAVTAAAVMAYGTDPYWGRFHKGLGLIIFARRAQWLLTYLSLLGSIALIGMVIAGKTRAAWLLTLAPVLALFVHRFVAQPMRDFQIAESPKVVTVADAVVLDNDLVVGLTFEHQAYAFPYDALFQMPVLLEERHEQRFVLIWSPYANRAVAWTVDNQFKLRDLELVSMPANAMLLFNRKLGQFINGLRGQTTTGARPTGFVQPIDTQKTTWAQWRTAHPTTVVLAPLRPGGPTTALAPKFPLPPEINPMGTPPPGPSEPATPVIMVASTQPVAMAMQSVTSEPVSVTAGQTRLLLFRDAGGRVRAFDRQVNDDLFPMLQRRVDPKHSEVVFVDRDSGSGWTIDGRAIEGALIGSQLRKISVDEGSYWGVLRYWYPDVQWVVPAAAPPGVPEFIIPPEQQHIGRKPKK